jgi:hypothetical protein
MKKILIISLFLFGQQAFSEVIPSDQLTGIYKNQGKTNTYIDNKIENKLDSVNNILCYLHSLRSMFWWYQSFIGIRIRITITTATTC